MAPLYFPKLIEINYELMLRIKWLWLMPNLIRFLSIFLKLQAVKQSGPDFLAYPVYDDELKNALATVSLLLSVRGSDLSRCIKLWTAIGQSFGDTMSQSRRPPHSHHSSSAAQNPTDQPDRSVGQSVDAPEGRSKTKDWKMAGQIVGLE